MSSTLTNPIVPILGAGLVAEFVLPWTLIGLSDMFLFDTPAWSLWAVFGGPPAITLVAILTRLVAKRWTRGCRSTVRAAAPLAVVLSLAAALQAGSWPAARADSAEGTLQVTVSNVRNSRGHIRLAICTRETFLHADCSFHGSAPAHVGSVTVKVQGVPPGTYAVQAFHDESDSGQIRLSLLGIPEEGVGFSGDAPIRFGGPSFADAAFQLPPAGGQVSLRLRHFD